MLWYIIAPSVVLGFGLECSNVTCDHDGFTIIILCCICDLYVLDLGHVHWYRCTNMIAKNFPFKSHTIDLSVDMDTCSHKIYVAQ